MDELGAVGAVQSKGIGGAAFRLINTKKLEFKVFNRTEKCIYNMKKFGDISTLSTGDRIKAGQEAVLSSQGLHTASGVVTFRIEQEMLAVAIAWSVTVDANGKNKCRLGVGFLQVMESYTEEVDMLLLKKIWREIIEKKCSQNKILTLSDYKRVDDEDSHGGKLELEWWREPRKQEDPQLLKLKKKMLKDSQKGSTVVEKNEQLIYNEVAHKVQDLGAGPFERFDSSPEQKKKNQPRKKSENSSSTQKSAIGLKRVKDPTEKAGKSSKIKPSKEAGFHTDRLEDQNKDKRIHSKRRKKRKKRSKSKAKGIPDLAEKVSLIPSVNRDIGVSQDTNSYGNLNPDAETNDKDDGVCKDCLMEHCGKSQNVKTKAPIDFSFIFKDDKPVPSQSETADPEAVNNPLEPIRIEEKVRKRRKRKKKKRSKSSTSAMKTMIDYRKDAKSKVNSVMKEHKIEHFDKNVPNPKRDVKMLANIQNQNTDSENELDTDETYTDDYYTIEADISSTGGYINIMSISVPVDLQEPDVIQRRDSDIAPISPRDEKVLLKTSLERVQKQQVMLEQELKEKESELEDLGCWRWLLAKRGKPIKNLTGSRKEAWKKEKQKFFNNVLTKQL